MRKHSWKKKKTYCKVSVIKREEDKESERKRSRGWTDGTKKMNKGGGFRWAMVHSRRKQWDAALM